MNYYWEFRKINWFVFKCYEALVTVGEFFDPIWCCKIKLLINYLHWYFFSPVCRGGMRRWNHASLLEIPVSMEFLVSFCLSENVYTMAVGKWYKLISVTVVKIWCTVTILWWIWWWQWSSNVECYIPSLPCGKQKNAKQGEARKEKNLNFVPPKSGYKFEWILLQKFPSRIIIRLFQPFSVQWRN